MSSLFKRLSSRRSEGPEGTEPPAAAEPGTSDAPATTPAEPEGHRPLFTDPAAPTRVLQPGDPLASPASDPDVHAAPATHPELHAAPLTPIEPNPYVAPLEPNPYVAPAQPAIYQATGVPIDPVADLPAGLDPDELAATPATSARRGRIRRRVAFLRAARELLLRDLGGFVYELHRTAHDVEYEAHRRLRETKLARLSRVDAELHELEIRLDDVRRQVLVREPGVGGECPHCGELFGSAAHYCSNCGLPLTEGARRELARSQQPQPAPEPVIAPEAAAAPVADQPTQEIPPLDPDHPNADPDFQWPRREGAQDLGSWAATPSGGTSGSATAETSDGEATPEPVASQPEAAMPAGESAASAPEAPGLAVDAAPVRGEAQPAAPGEVAPATTAGEPEAATPAELAPEVAASAETATPDAAAEDVPEPAPSDAEPASEAAPSEPDAATPAAEAATAENAPSDPEPAPPADDRTFASNEGEPVESRNGSVHDDSILRPVERRP